MTFKQGNLSVEDFTRQYEDLILRYDPTMSEQQRIDMFTQKLRPSLMMEVLKTRPTTYEEARDTALVHESVDTQMKVLTGGGMTATVAATIPETEPAILAVVSNLLDKVNRIDSRLSMEDQRRVGTNSNSQQLGQGGFGSYRQEGDRRSHDDEQRYNHQTAGACFTGTSRGTSQGTSRPLEW